MKLVLNIIVTFLLLYWPIAAMMSVMLFDAPGSTENRSAVLTALCVLFYPLLFGLFYYVLNLSFWRIRPKIFLGITLGIPLLASLALGYPGLLTNQLRGIRSEGYFLKDGTVYYDGSKIKDADAASFVSPSASPAETASLYAHDANHVYFRGKPVGDADPKTFQLLSDHSYSTDGKSIYFEDKRLPGADPATFKPITTPDGKATIYFKDKNAVYLLGSIVPGMQPATIQAINSGYLADSQNAYYGKEKIPGADAASLSSLSDEGSFARDKNRVYYLGYPVEGSDPGTFTVLERSYAKDKDHVFYLKGRGESLMLPEADAKKFKVTTWDSKTSSDGNDGTHFYAQGVLNK